MVEWFVAVIVPFIFAFWLSKKYPSLRFKKLTFSMPPIATKHFLALHIPLLVSFGLTQSFLDSFTWNINYYPLMAAILLSIWLFENIWYALSVLIQELALLSAFVILPIQLFPLIVIFGVFLHSDKNIMVISAAWIIISIALFNITQSVTWSITLHLLIGSLLLHKKYRLLKTKHQTFLNEPSSTKN